MRRRQHAHVLAGRGRYVRHRQVLQKKAHQPALTQRPAANAFLFLDGRGIGGCGHEEIGGALDGTQVFFQYGFQQQGVRIVGAAMVEGDQVIRGEMPRVLAQQIAQEIDLLAGRNPILGH